MMVLASGGSGCVGLDLSSGAFVRAQWPTDTQQPDGSLADLACIVHPEEELLPESEGDDHPLRVVEGQIASVALPFDPSRPEIVTLSARPVESERPSSRALRRLLDSVVYCGEQPLLGFNGPAKRYWEITGTTPSITLIDKPANFTIIRRPGEDRLARACFVFAGSNYELPVVDPRIVAFSLGSHKRQLSDEMMRKRLGWKPRYLVVALTGPRDGYCYRVVAAVLPEP